MDSEFDQEFASWELNDEEGLDDDPLYFVQAQQRPGADIHGASRVGDVERARSASYALNRHATRMPRFDRSLCCSAGTWLKKKAST